jgi:hypothetical protein
VRTRRRSGRYGPSSRACTCGLGLALDAGTGPDLLAYLVLLELASAVRRCEVAAPERLWDAVGRAARLLTHYADLGAADREAWQDRRMGLEGVEPRDLVRMHGQLLARGWLEQNAGATPALRPGVVAACYCVTAAGRLALRQARDGDPAEDERLAEACAAGAGRPVARRASRKGKAEPPAAAAVPAP